MSESSSQRGLVNNLISVSVAQSTIIVAKGALIIILGRLLGAGGYGRYTLVTITPILLATLLSMGVSRSVTYNISSGRFDRAIMLGNHIYILFGLALVVGGVQAAALFFFRTIFFNDLTTPQMVVSLAIGTLMVFQIINNGLMHGVQAFHRLPALVASQWSITLVIIVLLIIFEQLNVGTSAGAFAIGLTVYSASCLSCSQARSVWRIARPCKRYLSACLNFGSRASLISLANMISLRLDYYMISYFLSTQALGFYALATSACEVLLNLFSRGLDFVMLPWIAQKEESIRQQRIAQAIRLTFNLMAVIAVLAGIASPWLVRALFGPEYSLTTVCLILLLPGLVALSIVYALTGALMGMNQLHSLIVAGILSVIVTVGLDLLLIPLFGAVGAAVASSFAYVIQGVYLITFTIRQGKLVPQDYFLIKIDDWQLVSGIGSRLKRWLS